MKNILYLADCNLIHDLKWISFFSAQNTKYQCFVIMREVHAKQISEEKLTILQKKYNFKLVGIINDFSIVRFWQNFKQKNRIQQAIKDYKIDIFHIFYAEPNALWANFNYTCKIILTTRGTDVLKTIPEFFNKKNILAKLVSYFYKRAFSRFDAISSTSTQQIQSIENHLVKNKKIQLIRTGVDVDKILNNNPNQLLETLLDKKYILFPRNMRPIYNHEFAINSLLLTNKEIKDNYTVVFVDKNAQDKNYVSKIGNLLANSGLNYLFLDAIEQEILFELYKKAALVVMCPLSDGTPVSAIETMVCKTPLILPPLAYDKDIFSNGEVFLLANWEEKNLATAIEDILTKKIILDSEKAQQKAILLANRQTEMEKLAAIYAQILGC